MINFQNITNISTTKGIISSIKINKTQLWPNNQVDSIDNYMILNSIITDGYCWIDTGINAYDYNNELLIYNIKGQLYEYLSTSSNNYLFGCLYNNVCSGNISFRADLNKIIMMLGGSSSAIYQTKYGINQFEDFELTIKTNSNNNNIYGTINNLLFEKNTSATFTPAAMPNANIYLLHCNGLTNSSKGFAGKIYKCTISAENGTVLRDFVPCKSKDNVVGLYDLITNQFYTNQGTGNFIAEEIQIIPDDYVKINYIQTALNGSWIDTEIKPSDYPDGIKYYFRGCFTDTFIISPFPPRYNLVGYAVVSLGNREKLPERELSFKHPNT